MRRSRRAFLLFAAALGIVLALTMWQAPTESVAQRSANIAAARPDLEGGWVRIDPEGSGSFGGLTSKFSRAVLTPAAAAIPVGRDPDDVDPDAKPHGPGEPYIVSQGRCGGPGGAGGIEPNSAALFIVQADDEVLLTREGPGGRHIYMDGRAHPDLTRWTPIPLGHSVGRYEGGELVVDTMGLTPGAVTAGGRRTPETRLTERYRLTPDGKKLTITYTWNDPKLYQKPHTYSLEFDRLPEGSYAFEGWCDSSDPLQRQSIVPPAQLQ
jgi:hypothetical protein